MDDDFGKDLGVVHEAVVTFRKAGGRKKFWSKLAHDESLATRVVDLVINSNLRVFNVNNRLQFLGSIDNTMERFEFKQVVEKEVLSKYLMKVGDKLKKERAIAIFRFERYMTGAKVNEALGHQGYRAATPNEIIGFALQYYNNDTLSNSLGIGYKKCFYLAATGKMFNKRSCKGFAQIFFDPYKKPQFEIFRDLGWQCDNSPNATSEDHDVFFAAVKI